MLVGGLGLGCNGPLELGSARATKSGECTGHRRIIGSKSNSENDRTGAADYEPRHGFHVFVTPGRSGMFRDNRIREVNGLNWRHPSLVGGRLYVVERNDPYGICPKLACKALINNVG